MTSLGSLDAVLFDLDGVLTPTAALHRRAWAKTIGDFFERRGVAPPYSEDDYFRHIDGKPRFEGVASVTESRGIALPLGSVDDPPGFGSIGALGNLKNAEFQRVLETAPAAPYPGTVEVLGVLASRGYRLAVVSSSKNAAPVLRAAGLLACFELVVDGEVAGAERLAGKPSPETFEYAAAQLGSAPSRAVVVEDAISGVAAGRAGGFGLVVGVDRGALASALRAAGADVVISELPELLTLVRAVPDGC
ncbi:MAG: HAD-IA family hydrolase [Bifidobacteriaceae bacterium]|jgi:HAD superfamily hydrolase (TIGR01509 family)|nr:HAD-IA family hydrolase [Bifidobacteriaceae bacterium]